VTTVRDDTATMACGVCGSAFDRAGRQRFCSTTCRQAAWRRRRFAPVEPVVTRSATVYECPDCDARYLGDQRCDECNTWCRRVGPGGSCPCCDEPVAVADLVSAEQLTPARPPRRR
jgi:hypothetical protein